MNLSNQNHSLRLIKRIDKNKKYRYFFVHTTILKIHGIRMLSKKIFFLLVLAISFQQQIFTDSSHKKNKSQRNCCMLQTGDTLDIASYKKGEFGILYFIEQHGTTKKKAIRGEKVSVHYTGYLLEPGNKVGRKFDSSRDRNQQFEFPLGLGHVIKGWDIMVADMEIGEKRIVILPPLVAYGSRGAGNVIPGNATLIFEIELYSSR